MSIQPWCLPWRLQPPWGLRPKPPFRAFFADEFAKKARKNKILGDAQRAPGLPQLPPMATSQLPWLAWHTLARCFGLSPMHINIRAVALKTHYCPFFASKLAKEGEHSDLSEAPAGSDIAKALDMQPSALTISQKSDIICDTFHI